MKKQNVSKTKQKKLFHIDPVNLKKKTLTSAALVKPQQFSSLPLSSCRCVEVTNLCPDDERKRKQQQRCEDDQDEAAIVQQSSAQPAQHSVFLPFLGLLVSPAGSCLMLVVVEQTDPSSGWRGNTSRDSDLKLCEVTGYMSVPVGIPLSKTTNLFTDCWLSLHRHKSEIKTRDSS